MSGSTHFVAIDPKLPIAKTARRPYEIGDGIITKDSVADYCGIPIDEYDFFIEEWEHGYYVPYSRYRLVKLGFGRGYISGPAVRRIAVKPKPRRETRARRMAKARRKARARCLSRLFRFFGMRRTD